MSDIEILKNESGINLDYDEISPVTGNKCVIIEADTETGDEHRMCMESGYVTRSSLKFGSDAVTEYEKGCTELMIKLRCADNNLNTMWYPTFMQMAGAMLYCEGEGRVPSDYNWSVAKVVPIIGEERLKYPVPGTEKQYYTTRLDVDNAEKYKGYDFETALDRFYQILKEKQDG